MKIIVLIPGIMGSSLELPDEEVWPPTVGEVIFGYKRIQKLLRDDLEVGQIIRRVGPKAVYKTLIEDLAVCGYTEHSTTRKLVLFPYDWRRSNADTADTLADRMDQLVVEHPGAVITLMAHSMGGLISRYLLESGRYSGRSFFNAVTQLITLGTPHIGAPKALMQLEGKESNLGISGPDIQILGNDTRYPALFQLVGTRDNAYTVKRALRGHVPDVLDPFDSQIQQDLGMNAANVTAALDFWQGLNPQNKPPTVGYLCVIGTSFTTIVRSEQAPGNPGLITIDRKDTGDGTVPVTSAGLAGYPHLYSRKSHATVFEDRRFRRYLYTFLDAPSNALPQSADQSVQAGDDNAVGVAVGKETYAVGEPIEVVLSYAAPRKDPAEVLRIRRCDQDSGYPVDDLPSMDIELSLMGVALEEWRFMAEPDLEPGLYRIAPDGASDDPQATFFFVQ
ncbi:MAG: hypothetical protein AAGA91_01920 [Pseudomonadota bacterium]